MTCHCGSSHLFEDCCGAILAGKRKANTAEQLMRSRYSAYVIKDVDYLVRTTHPSSRSAELAGSIKKWMQQVEWMRLHILFSSENTVEFIAEYISEGKSAQHQERSLFKKQKGDWFYVGEA